MRFELFSWCDGGLLREETPGGTTDDTSAESDTRSFTCRCTPRRRPCRPRHSTVRRGGRTAAKARCSRSPRRASPCPGRSNATARQGVERLRRAQRPRVLRGRRIRAAGVRAGPPHRRSRGAGRGSDGPRTGRHAGKGAAEASAVIGRSGFRSASSRRTARSADLPSVTRSRDSPLISTDQTSGESRISRPFAPLPPRKRNLHRAMDRPTSLPGGRVFSRHAQRAAPPGDRRAASAAIPT